MGSIPHPWFSGKSGLSYNCSCLDAVLALVFLCIFVCQQHQSQEWPEIRYLMYGSIQSYHTLENLYCLLFFWLCAPMPNTNAKRWGQPTAVVLLHKGEVLLVQSAEFSLKSWKNLKCWNKRINRVLLEWERATFAWTLRQVINCYPGCVHVDGPEQPGLGRSGGTILACGSVSGNHQCNGNLQEDWWSLITSVPNSSASKILFWGNSILGYLIALLLALLSSTSFPALLSCRRRYGVESQCQECCLWLASQDLILTCDRPDSQYATLLCWWRSAVKWKMIQSTVLGVILKQKVLFLVHVVGSSGPSVCWVEWCTHSLFGLCLMLHRM